MPKALLSPPLFSTALIWSYQGCPAASVPMNEPSMTLSCASGPETQIERRRRNMLTPRMTLFGDVTMMPLMLVGFVSVRGPTIWILMTALETVGLVLTAAPGWL